METATPQAAHLPLGLEQPNTGRGRSHRGGRGRGRGRGNAQASENGEPHITEETAGQSSKPKRPRKKKSKEGNSVHHDPSAQLQEPGSSRSALNPSATSFEFRGSQDALTWQQQEMFGSSVQQGRSREQSRPAVQANNVGENGGPSTRGGRGKGGRGGRGRGDRGGRNVGGPPRATVVEVRTSTESLLGTGRVTGESSQQGVQQQQKKPRSHIAPKRSFGGGLTTEDGAGDGDEDQQPVTAPAAKPKKPQGPAKPKTVKEAEDLMGRLHQGIGNGSYECMVCYSGVSRRSKVWSCEKCYAVFHLHCIQKWSKTSMSSGPQETDGNDPGRTWRCPGCQNPTSASPNKYTCWCHKVDNPEVAKLIPPHSCGETCGKERRVPKPCPHRCELQCHAGPCPPCALMGPVQKCFCGRESKQKRCIDTDYENGWSCEQICAEKMPCGIHTCPQPCHAGSCGECMVWEEQKCYCGKHTRKIKCSEKLPCKKSTVYGENGVEEWEGYWKCHETCQRPYDCGIHHCEQLCHPQDAEKAHCPLSPDVKNTCSCGKTTLAELGLPPRSACTDPIPACTKACNKILACGHRCPKVCHVGDCGVCLLTVDITCRCGRTKLTSLCHQGYEHEPPQCTRVCKVIMNCGRHECGEKCCAGEQAAMDRLKSKKRQRPLGSSSTDEGFESQHICTRICGKTLKCGSHTCNMLCHRGPCGTCLEASFEELTCNCGRTSIPPPVRCGTKPPPCNFQCNRPKMCDHPAVPHNCHGDEENCPKCPYLTTKKCVCGKKEIKSQPCWRESVSCGTQCGKKLSCGSHFCRMVCHVGPCEEPCTQPCGKSKSCGHPCTEPCHAPFICHEEKPCQTKIRLMCDCGGIKQEIKCGATKTSPGGKKELKCGDACRARRMALALEIDPDGEGSAAKGYSDETCSLYKENQKWCAGIEGTLREFVDKATSKQLNFPPMKKNQRGFIHSLCEDYGLSSESQDPEPYRSVAVYKGTRLAMHPRKTIAQFIASKQIPGMPTATLHASSSTSSLISQLKKPVKQAFNALVLSQVQIGITKPELEALLKPALHTSQLQFTTSWIADEDVVLQPKSSSLSSDEIELELEQIKPSVKRLCMARGLATAVDLCWLGRDGKIAYREGQKWNVVGSKGGSGIAAPAKSLATPNAFHALSPSAMAAASAAAAAKAKEKEREKREKEKKMMEVVDDWEAVAEEEEKEEEMASVSGSGSGSGSNVGSSVSVVEGLSAETSASASGDVVGDVTAEGGDIKPAEFGGEHEAAKPVAADVEN